MTSELGIAVREELAFVVWWFTLILFQIIFGLLGMLVTCWFSRKREFRADAGSAELVGSTKMIKGLEALLETKEGEPLPSTIAAFGISGGKKKSAFRQFFSTHPPLEVRIERLKLSGR